MADDPDAVVVHCWVEGRWTPRFRRSLGPPESTEWASLAEDISSYRISSGPDVATWKLEPSVQFSTGFLYKEIFQNHGVCDLIDIWKCSIPAKIKIFLWRIARNRIPSGDQVLKRHGPGDARCVWCGLRHATTLSSGPWSLSLRGVSFGKPPARHGFWLASPSFMTWCRVLGDLTGN
jgi:hypothetical protein